jgi:chaperonin GroEL
MEHQTIESVHLSGGVAVIRVSVPAESERKSKEEALDDAISATKAAVAEGIVPGGGLALLRCVEAVTEEEAKCEGDEKTGRPNSEARSKSPCAQIAENSAVDGGVVVARLFMAVIMHGGPALMYLTPLAEFLNEFAPRT